MQMLGEGVTCSHAAPSWSEEGLPPGVQPLSYPLQWVHRCIGLLFSLPGQLPSTPALGSPSTPYFSVWRSFKVKGPPSFPIPGLAPLGRDPWRGDQLFVAE